MADPLIALDEQGRATVFDPATGDRTLVARGDVAKAVDAGLVPETVEQRQQREDAERYSSPVRSLAEGAARSLTFGLSDAAMVALGADAEGIRKRQELDPLAAGVGEAGGLVASSLIPGAGLARVGRAAEGVGARVAGAIAKEGAEGLAKRGAAAAAKAAIQGGAEGVAVSVGQTISDTALTGQFDLNAAVDRAVKDAALGGLFSVGTVAVGAASRKALGRLSTKGGAAREAAAEDALLSRRREAMDEIETLTRAGVDDAGLANPLDSIPVSPTFRMRSGATPEQVAALTHAAADPRIGNALTERIRAGLEKGLPKSRAGGLFREIDKEILKAGKALPEPTLPRVKGGPIKAQVNRLRVLGNDSRLPDTLRAEIAGALDDAASLTRLGADDLIARAKTTAGIDDMVSQYRTELAAFKAQQLGGNPTRLLQQLKREVGQIDDKLGQLRVATHAAAGSAIAGGVADAVARGAVFGTAGHLFGGLPGAAMGMAVGGVSRAVKPVIDRLVGAADAAALGAAGASVGKALRAASYPLLSATERQDLAAGMPAPDVVTDEALRGYVAAGVPPDVAADLANVQGERAALIAEAATRPDASGSALVAAASDPRSIMARIAQNRATPEDREVLERMFPQLATQLEVAARRIIVRAKGKLREHERRSLEVLAGQGQSAAKRLLAMQAAPASTQVQQQPGTFKAPGGYATSGQQAGHTLRR